MSKLIQAKNRMPDSLQYNAWNSIDGMSVVVPASAQTTTAIQAIKPLGLNYKITHISYVVSSFLAGGSAPVAGAVPLGAAATYAVIGSTTVTNSGATVVTGNLGLSPGSSLTGFPPGTVVGAIHVDDSAAVAAAAAAVTAYNYAQAQTPSTLVAADIGGTVITPGIYHAASTLAITGTVTLSGAGVYIFQIPSSLTANVSSVVALTNGATAANVFWAVGSSATLNGTTFNGTVLAHTSVSAGTGAVINGRLFANTGAVTLLTNALTITPASGSGGGAFAAGKMGFNIVSGVNAYEGADASSSYAYFTLGGTFATNDKITVTILGIAYTFTVGARDSSLQLIGQAFASSMNSQTLDTVTPYIYPGFNTLYRANSLGAEVVIQTLAYSIATPSITVSTNSVAGTITLGSGATMVAGFAGALPVSPVSDTTNLGIVPSQVAAVNTALFPVDIILPLFNASQADVVGTVYALENFDANWPTLAELTLRISTDGVVAGGLNVIIWGVPNDIHPDQTGESASAFKLAQLIL